MRDNATAITLAFDVYGTLIDTNGVITALVKHVGDIAPEFSRVWREKQLEYSFRRGLMRNYEKFSVCTSHALDYTSSYFNITLSLKDKEELLSTYKSLPAFADVDEGLRRAKEAGFQLFAFSNGDTDTIEALLVSAGIRKYFAGIVSVDEVKSFKPDPAVYNHFLQRADTAKANAWLVSSNPFDVIGAISAGMQAAWVQRSTKAIFDPWGVEPTITVSSLSNLVSRIDMAP